MKARTLGLVLLLVLAPLLGTGGGLWAQERREENLEELRAVFATLVALQVRATREETGIAELDEKVFEALARVPRHEFVPEELRHLAYANTALPVGHGQNISQPIIIALMTQLADVGPDDVVFETGTGAGYQAAILSLLARRVVSMEYVEPLARRAAATLARLGYDNVEVRVGDGYYGWPEGGPYDAILIKEAVRYVPEPLLRQLKPGGRLIAPVGPLDDYQDLTLIVKNPDGTLRERAILKVLFGPLPGGERI